MDTSMTKIDLNFKKRTKVHANDDFQVNIFYQYNPDSKSNLKSSFKMNFMSSMKKNKTNESNTLSRRKSIRVVRGSQTLNLSFS